MVRSPLQVVTNAKGKQQLIIDLRYVNQYLVQYKFKHEGVNVIPSLFQRGDFMITFNLKSGYHHVDINEDCWAYLGFSWYESLEVVDGFSCFEFFLSALVQLVMCLLNCSGHL